MKLGLANLNPTVGAIRSNTEKLLSAAREFESSGCDIAVFSEMVLGGYPAEDLVLWPSFVEQQWDALHEIAEAFEDSKMYLAVGLAVRRGERVYNCAALLHSGKLLGIVPKQELPTYSVFYEARTLSPGVRGEVTEYRGVPFGDLLFETPFGNLALEVCEDLWVDDGPLLSRVQRGATLSINLSASPWRLGVVDSRRELLISRSRAAGIPLIYVNQVGGNDGLVFDGSSLIARAGELLLETPRWQEQRTVVELKTLAPVRSAPLAVYDDMVAALTLGIEDYYRKTRAFKCIGVALSGGKDSALTLLLACEVAKRLGKSPVEFVFAFSMPTRFNSDSTRNVARTLAQELGVSFSELSIEDSVELERNAARRLSGSDKLTPLTEQNIQARIRAMRMWNWSNQTQGLWLQTGNMSEKSVGYTTIGGDLSGAYAPISNVPKTVVTALVAHYQRKLSSRALAKLLALKPSAELAANQEDERDLMPYPILDACFDLFAGEKLSVAETYEKLCARFDDDALKKLDPAYQPGQLREWVRKFARLFVVSIYKWVQAPQGIHVSDLDLDRERAFQLPVVQSLEWLKLDEF
ncbi:MAG: NAD(+) synthase [Calditrichaeota bacterium]|nr:NAD(+) synthase [Calditrichota bacterium]